MKDITLKQLRKIKFSVLYQKLLTEKIDDVSNYEKLLSIAVLFINSSDEYLTKLGYRIIVIYSNQTGDYKPLYDIALNEGLFPVVKVIENMEKYTYKFQHSFFNLFNLSYGEMFKYENIYHTEEQKQLYDFYDEMRNQTVSIIAPTSYGKSELIITSLKNKNRGNTCIIVPSKALLAQTRGRIMSAQVKGIHKIITHPEMYLNTDKNIIALLTQERLLRLLKKNPDLKFDLVIVDEAHNLLDNNSRSILLASVLIILEKRNNNIIYKFLTPFINNSANLETSYTKYIPTTFHINEYVKTEKMFLIDFRKDSKLKIYDQFIDDFYYAKDIKNKYIDDIDFILKNCGNKNIIYLNKPSDIEKFSLKLSSRLSLIQSEDIDKACNELGTYFDDNYSLVKCLKKGIIYHHGSVPEYVRIYIEYLYSKFDCLKYVVTSSTLLEGVNLPAEKMFLLDYKKGKSCLTPAQFKNLIGRVCRFREIFSFHNSLEGLEPSIYLVASDYIGSRANIENFIKKSMRIDIDIEDKPNNVLLKTVEINENNEDEKENAVEYLENYENGIIDDYDVIHTTTEIGKSCFANNIVEINIIKNENIMQNIINRKRKFNKIIFDIDELFNTMLEVFFDNIIDEDKNYNIRRLLMEESQKFYKMFLNWRIKNASFKEMITSFTRYWDNLINNHKETLVYVGKWGDQVRNGHQKLWTDIVEKTRVQRINLAIVRIKEEQDFLDNTLIKFIEVLYDEKVIDENFYLKIKYGTNNKIKITFIKNGFSIALTNLLVKKYLDYIKVDIKNNIVECNKKIIDLMMNDDENDILIIEAKYNMGFLN